MRMVAYVDGSFMNGMYGSGYVMFPEEMPDKKFTSGFAGKESQLISMRNVAGEILAVLAVVDGMRSNAAIVDNLTIFYDYEGIEKWVTGEWRAKLPFTQLYRDYMKKLPYPVSFVKVKSHSGNENNELADRLAKEAILNAGNI